MLLPCLAKMQRDELTASCTELDIVQRCWRKVIISWWGLFFSRACEHGRAAWYMPCQWRSYRDFLDIPLCAQRGVASRTYVRSVCEAVPMTHSSREGTAERLDLTSKQQQVPRQKLWKGLVIPSEDRSTWGKSTDESGSKGWSNQMSGSETWTQQKLSSSSCFQEALGKSTWG